MLSEENLMPSQFIKSNYMRLPAFTKITKRWISLFILRPFLKFITFSF
jgi:hypothetical protein